MTYARKVDNNHDELKKAFVKLGYSVLDLSRVAGGCPDILVANSRVAALIEIKSKNGMLTPLQELFHKTWRGKIFQARTLDDVSAIVRNLRAR